jgi:Lrp/AsnC family transcriptional regulator for asnA, asnC and gidA
MEDAGIIQGYNLNVDARKVGYDVSAFVGLRTEQGREEEALERLAGLEEVKEVHLTTGEWDVMARVFAEDTDALRELMFDHIADTEGFARSHTMVVLGTDYEADGLPL